MLVIDQILIVYCQILFGGGDALIQPETLELTFTVFKSVFHLQTCAEFLCRDT